MSQAETGNSSGKGTTTDGEGPAAVLEKLEYRCVGPHRGGRVVAVAGDPSNRDTFYFGACAGGVWKTTDGGTYWENISDGFFNTAAIGALAVAPSDPNVLYAGTGETTIRGNVSHGDGVYKSTDGGKTWSNIGLQDTRHIAKIRIHPRNPDLVYVAALGHAWGPNEERGVFRSSDGGKTWEKVLYRNENAGACDLSMDPNNPRILYAAIWQTRRYPWALSSGGPGSGLFRSTDGGDTWTEITRNPGLPKGVIGKIGVAVSPAKSGRVWALVEAKDGALFRSDDGGETWERLCEDGSLRWRAWYYMHLFADPKNPETCWVLDLQCLKSIDGGKTFSPVPTPHGDNHDLWIDPNDPLRMIEGNDGGACVSFNGGLSWSTIFNQPTAQFYHVTTDTQVPYRLYGSQQDNSAISVPSRSMNGAIGETDWYVPGGGESGYIAVRPDDPNVVFGGAIGSGFGNGLLWRYDHRTKEERNITAWPLVTGMAEGARDLKYRFQWTFPIEISPHDPNVLYICSNQVLRSTDEGESWEEISPDLTRNDKEKQAPSGGPITRDNTGAEVYDTIFAFAESPHQRGLFWAGTDDGLVHISRDGGKTWENITPPDLPEWALISIIEPSHRDAGTAYVAATCYKLDDMRPYLYKTSDYGKTWTRITNGIPENDFTRVIREDPEQPGLLYAGTETRVYVSFDDGANWQVMQGNLPITPIHDMVVRDGQLAIATHGRSFWMLDDLAILRELAKDAQVGGGARLFAPGPVDRYRAFSWSSPPSPGVNYSHAGPLVYGYKQRALPDGTVQQTYLDAGKNPPAGVAVHYYLPEKPEGDITLTFLDERGNEVRQFSSKKEKAPEPERDEEEAGSPAARMAATTAEDSEMLELGAEGLEAVPTERSIGDEEEGEQQEPTIPKEAGLNRFVWNLRSATAERIKTDKAKGVRDIEFFLAGPTVLPGRYQVRLQVGDQSFTESFELRPDPRGCTQPESLRAQHDLLAKIHDKLSEMHQTINQINDINAQLDGWVKRLEGQESAGSVVDAAKKVKTKLTAIAGELNQEREESPLQYPIKLNAQLASLVFAVDFSDSAPTKQAHEVYEELAGKIDAQLQAFQQTLDQDLAALNRQIRDAEMPAIAPRPAEESAKEREMVPAD